MKGGHAGTKSVGSPGTYKLGHSAGTDLKGNATGKRNHFGPVKPTADAAAGMPTRGFTQKGC